MIAVEDTLHKLTDDATLTFGIEALYGTEIVGPMKPRSVHFGKVFGSDSESGSFTEGNQLLATFPLIHMDWNKYRPDLPPWNEVEEFVIADTYEGDVVEYVWVDTNTMGIATTGDLKTVSMHAASIHEGNEGYILDSESVREHREKVGK